MIVQREAMTPEKKASMIQIIIFHQDAHIENQIKLFILKQTAQKMVNLNGHQFAGSLQNPRLIQVLCLTMTKPLNCSIMHLILLELTPKTQQEKTQALRWSKPPKPIFAL